MKTVRRGAWVLLATFLIVGCSELLGEIGIATIVSGTLVDDAGDPLAGAVVFLPSDGSTASLRVAQPAATSCQEPSLTSTVATCTDAQGRFSIEIDAPLSGTVRLIAELRHIAFTIDVTLSTREPGTTVAVGEVEAPKVDPDDEIEAAVRYALPSLSDFDLIAFDDANIVTSLRAYQSDTTPLILRAIPLRQPNGERGSVDLLAYRFQPRAEKVEECAFDPKIAGDTCTPVTEPAHAFRGMPDVSVDEIVNYLRAPDDYVSFVSDESIHQLSVVNLIGDELDLTYYGTALSGAGTPSSMQGLRSVLDVAYPADQVEKLLSLTQANYLLHNQIDLDVEYIVKNVLEDAVTLDGLPELEAADAGGTITPTNHFGDGTRRVIRAVMVADPTVYDPVTDTRLVPNYFSRLDAMINRMDLFFRYVQVFPGDPTTTLADWGNAVSLEAEIAEYRRLTESGLASHSFPSVGCGSTGDYVSVVRSLSRDAHTYDNEFWMWWTNTTNYSGLWGCAYINALKETPADGAVGFTSFRNYALETVGQTFMHETGHLMNAVHSASASGTQCRLLGIFPFGVTGPSMLGSTSDRNLRANCFAQSGNASGDGSPKRNVTRVAEFVHTLP